MSVEFHGKTGLIEKALFLASPILVLGLWEAAARSGFVDARFFVPPSKILVAMWSLMRSGDLGTHTGSSLLRVFWGRS